MSTPDAEHRAWLGEHRRALLVLVDRARHPAGGFAWLDAHARPRLDRDRELWINARMTHVAGLGVLEGLPGAEGILDHGMAALQGPLRDHEHGGWHAAVGPDGPTVTDKRAYEHAFVVLAGATALAAGHADGEPLLRVALHELEARFWDDDAGMVVDVFGRDWSEPEPYRGVNANMHTVEALLAAFDVTGDERWRDHAARVVERVVHRVAVEHDHRLPEHFTPEWEPLPDYNVDEPGHPFRPYGVTVGHLVEWARLTLHLRTALGEPARGRSDWMVPQATALFRRAVADGWSADGAEGFVYTTDFAGRPVVRSRLHWVLAEAIAAAWALHLQTGEQAYLDHYRQWWAHAREHYVDARDGSWRHELDPANRPAASIWDGRPDVYHAYQVSLLPELGEAVSFAGGARRAFTPRR